MGGKQRKGKMKTRLCTYVARKKKCMAAVVLVSASGHADVGGGNDILPPQPDCILFAFRAST